MASRSLLNAVLFSVLLVSTAFADNAYQCEFAGSSLDKLSKDACASSCECMMLPTNQTILGNETESVDEVENVAVAFALVTGAGLSTTIGAAAVFCDKLVVLQNRKLLALSLGFSAGVMLLVSLMEIVVKSQDAFTDCRCLWPGEDADDEAHGDAAFTMAVICFFCGIIITYLLDACVYTLQHATGHGHSHAPLLEPNKPTQAKVENQDVESNSEAIMDGPPSCEGQKDDDSEHICKDCDKPTKNYSLDHTRAEGVAPVCMCEVDIVETLHEHSMGKGASTDEELANDKRLEHMSIMTALAIALHNFPEGLATFVATLADPSVGAALAVAIAIHNIPEGLCVSIPVYYSSGSRWKGFMYAFWSGVSEIIGAAIGYFLLQGIFGDLAYGILFGIVSGMMVAICLKELIPTAHRYDPHDHVTSTSIIMGMFVMALSLVLFRL